MSRVLQNGATAPRTSHLLQDFAAGRSEAPVTVREIADVLGERSFGLVLVVLALPAWIPVLPPGVPSLFGLAIATVACQMLLGRAAPWLPGFVAQRGLPAERFARLVERAAPWLRRIEAVCRPRLGRLLASAGTRLVALWILVLALVICVPFPMTNSGPALSIAVIALGIIGRDGLVVLAGAVLGMLSLAVAVAFWGGAFVALQWLIAA